MKQSKRMLAMALLAVFGLSTVGCADNSLGSQTESIVGNLVAAQYPQMASYPETTKDWDEYEKAYDAWRTSRKAQQAENEDYKAGIAEFCRDTIEEFLGGVEGENKIYSPLNLYMALALLAETTAGETQEQILTLLHTDTIENLRDKAKMLWNANYCDDGAVTSLLASSIWLSDSLNYKEEVLQTLADTYYASSFSGTMGSAQMNESLQKWLNEQTGGMLQEQAGNIELNPDTVFALATTVYYRAKWSNEFLASKTSEDIFYTKQGEVTCEFMYQGGSNTYYWGENFSAIARSLQNSGTMLLILPDEEVAVEDLLSDNEVLDFMLDYRGWENKKYLVVHQSVPKFDVVAELDFKTALQNLGVTDVCDENKADFSALTEEPKVYLQQATHAARVKIDEEGCMAAAFTVMANTASAMPPEEEVDFVLNRPFLFVLNGQDGQPLFIGIVNQP